MTIHCTYSCDSCGAVFDKIGAMHEYPLKLTEPTTPHQGARMHICRTCAAKEASTTMRMLLAAMPSLTDRQVYELWSKTVVMEREYLPDDDEDEEGEE